MLPWTSFGIERTNCCTASTVASGPPGWRRRILPALSITQTPLMVPRGDFLNPMALIKVDAVSQSREYGRFCLDLKLVLAFGESADRP
jgi:hypothetical protein